jgi:hypothetical protein
LWHVGPGLQGAGPSVARAALAHCADDCGALPVHGPQLALRRVNPAASRALPAAAGGGTMTAALARLPRSRTAVLCIPRACEVLMDYDQQSRRRFNAQALGSLLTFSLLETLARHDLFAAEVRPQAVRWLSDVNQLGLDLKGQSIDQLAWQKKVEELLSQVDLPDVLSLLDFDRLTATVKFAERGERSLRFTFPKVEGVPTELSFGKQIFALSKGRSVVPHGHNNMATAFLILKGTLRGRHYDRLKDEPGYMIIRPTIDRAFEPGECSTISDYKDNVHWFAATSSQAFIFNLHVMDVNPGTTLPTGRVYVDPEGEKLAGGLIRARRIDFKEANKLYG